MRALPLTLAPALAVAACYAPANAADASPLTGTWRIQGMASTKGRGPDLGELKVDAGGSYQWSEGGHLSGLGTLQLHRPSGGARSGQDCWLFHRGKGDLYAFPMGSVLEIYDAASNTLMGTGTRQSAKAPLRRR